MNRRAPASRLIDRPREEPGPGGSAGLLGSVRRRPSSPEGGRAAGPGCAGARLFGTAYLAMLLAVIALVAGAFVFHLHLRYEGIRLGYETSRVRTARTRLLLERRELRLELATLKSPRQIEAEARERLGMVAPDNSRIVPIRPRRTMAASGGVH